MKPVNDFFMAGISALSFYQCFDTVGYMTFCLQKNTPFKRALSE